MKNLFSRLDRVESIRHLILEFLTQSPGAPASTIAAHLRDRHVGDISTHTTAAFIRSMMSKEVTKKRLQGRNRYWISIAQVH